MCSHARWGCGVSPATSRERPPGPKDRAVTIPGTAGKLWIFRSVLMSQRLTTPLVLPTAIVLLSGLIARLHVCSEASVLAAMSEGTSPRRPVRSHARTLVSRLPVYRVEPSALMAWEWIGPACPASVWRIVWAATVHRSVLLSLPLVMSVLPLGVKSSTTAPPVWAPVPSVTLPVARLRKRTDPSAALIPTVSPPGLTAAETPPTG